MYNQCLISLGVGLFQVSGSVSVSWFFIPKSELLRQNSWFFGQNQPDY
jgi:hypothetical protein